MILEKIDVKKFLKDFEKSFSNFCKKVPLLLTYAINDSGILIYSKNIQIMNYTFDFSQDIKNNINNIKQILIKNFYPIMTQVKTIEKDISATELSKLVSSNKISIDEAANYKEKIKEKTDWRIEKVIMNKDELFVRNLSLDKIFRFKLNMPVSFFLRNVREKYSQEEAFEIFDKKKDFLNEIFDNYVKEN